MHLPEEFATRDHNLVQIVDSALADATRRSGHWLKCQPGCTQCCVGPFAISQLDAARLQKGLADLEARDPKRALRIQERVRESVARLSPEFPGDAVTSVLDESEAGADKFAEFANDETCPVLDPESGTCDLYSARPMTCRVFGPPVRSDGGLGVCELCFRGASEKEIAACELKIDAEELEAPLLQAVEDVTKSRGSTIVAFSLKDSGPKR